MKPSWIFKSIPLSHCIGLNDHEPIGSLATERIIANAEIAELSSHLLHFRLEPL